MKSIQLLAIFLMLLVLSTAITVTTRGGSRHGRNWRSILPID